MSPESRPGQKSSSSNLLVIIGTLWLMLAAALLIYQFAYPPRVEITWETATEQQTVGFNLYRSNDPESEFVLVNEDQIIDSMGSPVTGAQYSFIDDNVESGQTYYYMLEEVEVDSSKNRYDNEIFEYKVPEATWWIVVLSAASVLIGLILLLKGLNEVRT